MTRYHMAFDSDVARARERQVLAGERLARARDELRAAEAWLEFAIDEEITVDHAAWLTGFACRGIVGGDPDGPLGDDVGNVMLHP